jgi:hypothetical protein
MFEKRLCLPNYRDGYVNSFMHSSLIFLKIYEHVKGMIIQLCADEK